jgi:hypothetical protein
MYLATICNSTGIEVCKDIIRICQKIATRLNFIYIAVKPVLCP